MHHHVALVIAALAFIVIVSVAAWAWLRWLEAVDEPQPRPDGPYHGRHAGPDAGRVASTGELESWREDWTDTELRALGAGPRPPAAPGPAWSFHRWEIEQEQWLEARRREAHEYALVLRSGAWADPWWTRH